MHSRLARAHTLHAGASEPAHKHAGNMKVTISTKTTKKVCGVSDRVQARGTHSISTILSDAVSSRRGTPPATHDKADDENLIAPKTRMTESIGSPVIVVPNFGTNPNTCRALSPLRYTGCALPRASGADLERIAAQIRSKVTGRSRSLAACQ